MNTDDPLVQAGKALLAQGRAPEAVRVLQRAVERAANEPQGFFFLGHAHLQARNPQAAVPAFAEVVRMVPADQAVRRATATRHCRPIVFYCSTIPVTPRPMWKWGRFFLKRGRWSRRIKVLKPPLPTIPI